MTADDIVSAARSALGSPFLHQGRSVERGMDCAGLIIHICNLLGIECIDQSNYARIPSGGALEIALDSQPAIARVKGQACAGDILLMRFTGDPQHLGIFTGSNIIHAYQPIGKVCEHGFVGKWPRRLVRVYRFSGVEA